MKIKRYQLLQGFQHTTFFSVNGVIVTVTFQHGVRRPFLVRGRFSTDNEDLQNVMEADNGFNTLFYLEQTDEGVASDIKVVAPEKQIPAQVETEEPLSKEKTEPIAEATPSTTTELDFPEITNLKDARQKLLDMFPEEIKISQIPNKLAIFKKAKEKNITFSKLA